MSRFSGIATGHLFNLRSQLVHEDGYMKKKLATKLDARILGQLLLMQSVMSHLPDEQAIFSFVCRGIVDIPGVVKASFSEICQEPGKPLVETSIVRFPLTIGDSRYGELLIQVSDPLAF